MSRNCKTEFGGIEKAESGELVREARENSTVQETSRTISVIQIDVNKFLRVAELLLCVASTFSVSLWWYFS
jgi:hypothetical protein